MLPRLPPGPSSRRLSALTLVLTALLGSLLTACGPLRPAAPKQVLSLAVAIGPDADIDSEQRHDLQRWIDNLERSFAIFHPGVTLRMQMFSDDQILAELQRRHASGLGPDLAFVSEKSAFEIAAQGLSRPIRPSARVLAELDPGSLQRLKRPDGRLRALPLLIQPELACYDRRRLQEPPATLEALLAASADGVRVGLPLDPLDLAWTLGSLGAGGAMRSLQQGRPASAAQRQQIAGWLRWMQAADLQHRVTFLPDRQALEQSLRAGQMDWISCRSMQLVRLRRLLGPRLAVSVLPSGPGGPPSPLSSLRLFVLGTDSSPAQRRLAERLALFAVNPQVQSALTLNSLSLLPVNRLVPVPVASSDVLASLAESHRLADRDPVLGKLLQPGSPTSAGLRQVLLSYLYGDSDLEQATNRLIALLSARPPSTPARP